MGSDISQKDNKYEMNVTLIGNNINKFVKCISNTKKKSIKKYWNFDYSENDNVQNKIDKYFQNLKQRKEMDKKSDFKETLIIKINNISSPEIEIILGKMNGLGQTHYMPLLLVLLEDFNIANKKIPIDNKKYKRLDSRLIFLSKYSENPNIIEKEIDPILLRFCSILNELGDRFTVGKGNNAEDYDLIENYFPFNINIACIGRFGQGKSTGVNEILQEYKAKESSKGCSQTKDLTVYQSSNYPVRILDIPGFDKPETVEKAVAQFKKCGEKINKIKDNIHIILYFLKYTDDRTIMDLEYPIFEEMAHHKSSKIIFVITHSNPDMDEVDKEEQINRINEGIQEITKNKKIYEETMPGKMLHASEKNVAFVNFHKDIKTNFEPFGKRELFKKIHDFFVMSEDFISSKNKLDPNIIEKNALKLREQGRDLLFSNKVWGGVVGIIPGVDWALQKYVVKKNAAKKLGRLFGIDVKFVDEINKEKKISETKSNEKTPNGKTPNGETPKDNKPEYITPSIDEDYFILKGEELTKESGLYKVGNTFKVSGEASAYVGGGASITSGILRASTEATSTIGSASLKIIGTGAFALGAVVGVGLGGYFTHKYCEDLLNKFVEFYKKNAEEIDNSYNKAANYFLNI